MDKSQDPYLCLVVPTWLDRRLGVTDLFEHTSALLKVLSKDILLLGDLSEENTELVREVRNSIIASLLTPFTDLRSDVILLLRGVLVCADDFVLRLDYGVQLLGEIGLADAAERGHFEAVTGRGLGGVILVALGADRECAVPEDVSVSEWTCEDHRV